MKMLLGGDWVNAQDGSVMEILNPSDQTVLDSVPSATKEDVDNAVAAALSAKSTMAAMPAHKRAEILETVSARITENRDHLVKLLNAENGKTFREIDGWEIDAAARIIKGYAEEAKRLFGHAMPLNGIPNLENSLALTVYQPKGVIAAIIPFNYPVELWSHKIAGGLAAGNCVITKAPDECPLAMLEISRYYEEAGLPAGAHQILTGRGEVVGARLAEIDGVDMVSMTGSTEVGRLVSAAASKTLKKVHLELGGSDATIICGDVDPQVAAEAVVAGRFTSGNGQICCAVKRVFVDQSIHQEVVDRVVALTRNLKVGDHTQPDTDVGPMITQRAADGVKAQIDQSVEEGATLLIGGEQHGQHINPAVFVDVPDDSTLLHEEVFGPVLPLIPFDGIEDAIAKVNNSIFGLQASIFTNDFKAIMNAGLKLEVGTVIVNHQTAMRIECLPFGGRKLSGNGVREGLMETLKDFSETKTIVLKDAFNVYETASA
ncbi:aldehyde dehydrogenase family protein [Cognatishimia activa]|uniref:NADP-dependent glyceraldehyde-3-phosphate dehydrogenase n=1 Tax=Cognatishimia activa TaxID=1715691 RepID=A0A0P1JD85_9RHOB|nr:aldehyde dehydrogenase family protein [Cognatishimia activa]CUI50706.1 NADP-dependent glyceraldehyde-3-phosphate dehydrogenase [Cognatishimia activa]CUK27350.1 NADP-dependent glyceraldehyde-3-phosphate dehydrogenase [Cognatishimia activa]